MRTQATLLVLLGALSVSCSNDGAGALTAPPGDSPGALSGVDCADPLADPLTVHAGPPAPWRSTGIEPVTPPAAGYARNLFTLGSSDPGSDEHAARRAGLQETHARTWVRDTGREEHHDLYQVLVSRFDRPVGAAGEFARLREVAVTGAQDFRSVDADTFTVSAEPIIHIEPGEPPPHAEYHVMLRCADVIQVMVVFDDARTYDPALVARLRTDLGFRA